MMIKSLLYLITMLSVFFMPEAFSAGLDAGIQATSDLKSSAYKWLGVMASGYIIFNILMAYLGRKGWGDVAMSVLYCAIAGGAVLLGIYAWGIWG